MPSLALMAQQNIALAGGPAKVTVLVVVRVGGGDDQRHH